MEARVGARAVRSPLLAVTFTFLLVAALSLVIVLAPQLRPSFRIPRFDVAIEAAGAIVALLAVALAYLRYSRSGDRLWVFIGAAFLVLGSNRAFFGIFLPAERIGPRLALYIWAAGRLIGAGLFLAAAFSSGRPSDPPEDAAKRFATTSALWIGILIGVDAGLWALRDRLPPLATDGAQVAPERILGVLPGLTAVDIGLGLVGTAAYLLAALAFLRRIRRGEETPGWLPPALVLAAFSHVHYALLPTVFTAQVSVGDLLRLAFSVAVLLGLARDVSRTYAAERDRSHRLAMAYEDEQRRVEQLEEADRARAELFEILTHELMHPVSSIRGLTVTLTKAWEKLDDDTRRDFVSRIDRESQRLRALAESAATVADLEGTAFRVVPRPLPAVELAREAAESVGRLGGRLMVRSELEPSVHVLADPLRIQQVFRNLLSNAEKYAPEGVVELAVEPHPTEVLFSVIDRGPGIEPGDRARLFRRYSRVRPRGMESIPGSGLGLYIGREIVEAHRGRIWVDSEPGKGAAFRFTLPRAEE